MKRRVNFRCIINWNMRSFITSFRILEGEIEDLCQRTYLHTCQQRASKDARETDQRGIIFKIHSLGGARYVHEIHPLPSPSVWPHLGQNYATQMEYLENGYILGDTRRRKCPEQSDRLRRCGHSLTLSLL